MQDEMDMLRSMQGHLAGDDVFGKLPPVVGQTDKYVSDFGTVNIMPRAPARNPAPIAPAKKVFVACDYSQIEARVLAWLAGQQDILDVFARGDDVYVYTANKIGSTNRQLGKVCVLGLGFGMGWMKFIATAKLMGGLDLEEQFAQDTVREWRLANAEIVRMWYKLDDTFRAAIAAPGGSRLAVPGTPLVIERGKDAIGIFLPSKKRRLIYRNPRLMPNPESFHETKTDIVYDGVQQMSKRWGPIKTYGGKLAENVTQAVARDVMASGLLEMDERLKLDLRMTVHDEVIAVCDEPEADAVLRKMLGVMRTAPPWAQGLPVHAEGWAGRRYRK